MPRNSSALWRGHRDALRAMRAGVSSRPRPGPQAAGRPASARIPGGSCRRPSGCGRSRPGRPARSTNRPVSACSTPSEVGRRATTIARHSRVHSSITVSMRNHRPSCIRSCTTSQARTCPGEHGRSRVQEPSSSHGLDAGDPRRRDQGRTGRSGRADPRARPVASAGQAATPGRPGSPATPAPASPASPGAGCRGAAAHPPRRPSAPAARRPSRPRLRP